MKKDSYGQFIYTDNDLIDCVLESGDISTLPSGFLTEGSKIDIVNDITQKQTLIKYSAPTVSINEFDQQNQAHWHMPVEYLKLDIAKYILDLCDSDAELQRCGEELLLYQKNDLFNLLKYLKYLVDTMQEHNIIWGVGRGSSVASFVLYKMGVHKINSLYYDLDPLEFFH